ncbi:hypothetical protein RUM44_007223 [Polyplax serrata]|uniref:Nuclear pore protein n=1 Tax=Polyplax serrata TaxID=468196 RepID=A0ABR1B0W0_POLSC
MADAMDFDDLLNAAELLAADTDGSGDLPKWNRTIHQLAEAAEEMWTRLGSKAGGQENQANVLLAPKGIDIPQMTEKLQSLSTRKTFQPLEPIADIDVKLFLKNEYENGILSVIALNQKQSAQNIRKTTWSHTKRIWQTEKNKIANAMLESKTSYLDFAAPVEESFVQEIPSAKSMLSHEEMVYAKEVAEYNKTIMTGLVYPNLINNFYAVSKSFNDKKVIELWEMVKYMADIPPRPVGDVIEARATQAVQNILISQAKKYLEERYRAFMTNVVSTNLQKAMRGGIPGTYPLVRSFVGIRVSSNLPLEDGCIDGQPVWPLIYYCLRCGDVNAALQVALQAEGSLAEFSQVLEKMTTGKLSSKMEQMVKAQYRRYIRNTSDPFKKAVYCVVGSCDVNDEHKEVAQTADDYLWFKLCQINDEDNAETKGERMSYSYLQSLILEQYGETHYKAYEQPHIYFEMLILTGQFEAAIEFLYRVGKFKVHAVHIAIALHEMGLLADPPSVWAALMSVKEEDKPPARRLNFARLITLYVQPFQVSDPKEAIHYFYFLRDMQNHLGENMFTLCVSDLVQESRDFDLILGRLETDGCRTPGLIDLFKGLKQSSTEIVRYVASECERKGNLEDAVNLYDLANEHEKVLSIMNILMTQVLTQPNKTGSLRSRMQILAHMISTRYSGLDYMCSAETASVFFLLRDLMTFFDQYHAEHYVEALNTITRSKLLPMTKEEVPERVFNFKKLSDQVKRHFADIMLVTMNILQIQYNKARGGERSSPAGGRFEESSRERQQMLSYITEKASAITNFAGSIPYRMKGDTNSRLVQMEILMH